MFIERTVLEIEAWVLVLLQHENTLQNNFLTSILSLDLTANVSFIYWINLYLTVKVHKATL